MKAELFSYPIAAAEIPTHGRSFGLEADAEARRRLADALGIPAVVELKAQLDVQPAGSHALSVRGTLQADVVQNCVVTLDPVRQHICEEIDLSLREERPEHGAKRREVLVDPAEPDPPDIYRNGRIDLGAIVAEHLALGLDPYPRAPHVDFADYAESDAAADPSPFAALAKLKPGGE